MAGERTIAVLRNLTALQHTLFVTLVAIGVARAWPTANRVTLVVAITVLTCWYAVGARRAEHRPAASSSEPGAAGPARAAIGWLLILAVLWIACVAVSPHLIWVGFALWLLAAHLLPLAGAAVFAAGVLAVVIGAPVLAGQGWSVGGVVGPTVGALFALALSRGQVLLARESIERARLVRSLVRAQDESAALQEQLAAAQRDAGAQAERTRLSREIHDTLAQGFSSILLLARGASVAGDEVHLRHLLDRIEETAAGNLAEARRVVGALAPESLQDNGLAAALRRIVADLAADTGIDTDVRVDPDLPLLDTGEEVVLLRSAQGALANVRTHARAARVVVSLTGAGDQVRLDVVDDGVGFDPGQLAAEASASAGAAFGDRPGAARLDYARGGYGLASTTARLRELGGGLTIESAPGDGTAVSAYLPVRRAQPEVAR